MSVKTRNEKMKIKLCWLAVQLLRRPRPHIGPRDNNLSFLDTGNDKRLISWHNFIEGASRPNFIGRITSTSKSL